MQTQNSSSLEFVKSLYSLSSNQQSQHLITGIYQMGFSLQPLDDTKANQIAQAVAPFLPQQQSQNPLSGSGFNMMGFPGPTIGGYQMNAPSINPVPITGTVSNTAGKKPFYSEQDFRNMLAQGKSVCHKTIAGNSERKGSHCCVEIKIFNPQLPADQQVCAIHNKAKKGTTAMNGTSIANSFTNMQFAPPIGLPNQTPIGGMQQQPWQNQQTQINTMQQQPWQNQQIQGLNQQQLTPVASVIAPGLGLLNKSGVTSQQMQNSNPFSIGSNHNVGLTPPPSSLGGVANIQMPTISMNQQTIPSSFNSLNGIANIQIPTISINQQQTIPSSFNSLGGVANIQIPGMIIQQPQISIPSLTSSMNNMSVGQQFIQPIQQNLTNQDDFFIRKMGNNEFYFNSNPIVSGIVFENTINGIVCIGRIGTTVNNDGTQLPADFKSMIGNSFTIDHDNWLNSKNIVKKDTSIVIKCDENIQNDYQADDA